MPKKSSILLAGFLALSSIPHSAFAAEESLIAECDSTRLRTNHLSIEKLKVFQSCDSNGLSVYRGELTRKFLGNSRKVIPLILNQLAADSIPDNGNSHVNYVFKWKDANGNSADQDGQIVLDQGDVAVVIRNDQFGTNAAILNCKAPQEELQCMPGQ